jgi:hypothetical protein
MAHKVLLNIFILFPIFIHKKIFITTKRVTGEIIFRQSCAKKCAPSFNLDPLTDTYVQTTCCSANNCNFFDLNSITTTTMNPSSLLSCYVGVGPNVNGISSSSQILSCTPPTNNFCSVKNKST